MTALSILIDWPASAGAPDDGVTRAGLETVGTTAGMVAGVLTGAVVAGALS